MSLESLKFSLLLASLLIYFLIIAAATAGETEYVSKSCIERERQALLQFKQGLVDHFGLLDSWGSDEPHPTDCCQWKGVHCSNLTGYVISLDLRAPPCDDYFGCKYLRGGSVLVLEHLSYLDLSGNYFDVIPGFIGSLVTLQFLNLSFALSGGDVSYQFQNLSALQFLDLSYNEHLSVTDLTWLPALSSLKILNLSGLSLHNATDWANAFSSLPSLTHLKCVGCSLPNIIPSPISHVNSSKSLVLIDLSSNGLLPSSIYPILFNFSTSLVELHLSGNVLQGTIPQAFGRMVTLSYLSLSHNILNGSLPESLGNLSSLTHLDLSQNQLDGRIPNSFSQLCSLRTLELSQNYLRGEAALLFQSLSGCAEKSLRVLHLHQNDLHGSLPDITKFSSLTELGLSKNQLNGTLPSHFEKHCHLEILDLSDNGIFGSLPELSAFQSLKVLNLFSNSLEGTVSHAHLSNLSELQYLNLSFNKLVFHISPNWTVPFTLDSIALDSCLLGPRFPNWLRTQNSYSYLSMANAGISDPLPEWFWSLSPNANHVNLSHNQIHGIIPDSSIGSEKLPAVIDLSSNSLNGSVPLFLAYASHLDLSHNKLSGPLSSFCSRTGLTFLDLSYNSLSGELPDCWTSFVQLRVLNLESNALSGRIPSSLAGLLFLEGLNLGSNKLHGVIPPSLNNLMSLRFLDLSENSFSGDLTFWAFSSEMGFLILRRNNFSGSLSSRFCHLFSLRVLDLSENNISGRLPDCNTENLSERVRAEESPRANLSRMKVNESLMWKGAMHAYLQNLLEQVISIDLSSNRLTGEIPGGLFQSYNLQSLNLSRNRLTGPITAELGNLKLLESLDLSRNQLSGEIPASLSNLNFLSTLDLSYNNLSGRIPSGTQLQSRDASSYMGNPGLCGLPLDTNVQEMELQQVKPMLETLLLLAPMMKVFLPDYMSALALASSLASWEYVVCCYLNDLGDIPTSGFAVTSMTWHT